MSSFQDSFYEMSFYDFTFIVFVCVLFCFVYIFLLDVDVEGTSRVGHCKLAKALNAVVCGVVYAILYTCPHTDKH